jgi:predicted nuclease of predicted toxin-antitoxin system
MRLLFDQNLSPRLVDRLDDIYPNSVHVAEAGLDRALDREIWAHAREQDLAVVTKDADFGELSVLRGFPPNVIWIRRGNCSTQEIENLLRRREDAVKQLRGDEKTGVIELY